MQTKNEYEIICNFTSNEEFVNNIMRNNIFPSMMKEFNDLLLKYADFQIDIVILGESIYFYRKDGPDLQMSGGFYTRLLDIIFRIIFTQISTKIKTNFFIIDEAFDKADSNNIDTVANLIKRMSSMYDWLLIISHDNSVKEHFDKIFQITSKDNIHTLVCD